MATPDERGKEPVGKEAEDVMEEESLPRRGMEVERVDLNFPHYIQLRRTDAKERDLPKKEVTSLVAPRIPIGVPFLKDILPKLARLKFQDFDTR